MKTRTKFSMFNSRFPSTVEFDQEYNFKKQKSLKTYCFYDKEKAISICIIPSGWNHKYHCIVESGEFEMYDILHLNEDEIREIFNIDIIKLQRRKKLKKLNETIRHT